MHNAKILSSGPEKTDLPRCSIGDIVFNNLKKFGTKTALIDAYSGNILSFRDVLEKSVKLCSIFKKLGIKKGDIISVLSENDIQYFIPYIACLYTGVIVNNLSPNYTTFELTSYLGQTNTKLIFCSEKAFNTLYEIKKTLTNIRMIILLNGEPQRDATNLESILELGDFNLEKFELEKIDPKVDIALILYSSGTTGMPKGVLLTHANLRMPFVYMGPDGFESNLSDIYVQVTPCTHIIGTMMFGAVFGYGSTLIFLKKFEPEMLLKTIEKYKVNKVMFVPQIILFLIKTNLLEKYDISTLTKFYCGGAMLNKDTVDQFLNKMKYCKLQQVYGLTETTGATIMSPKDDNTGSIGKIMPNNRCKIVDILTGKAVGPNEIGEICIIGDSICNGYHNREDATRELIDDDGFVHTGDVGYYNENELIYVIDRIKDIIKHKGFQVSPAEIETVLMLHDSVEDVGAIGIPDQRSGEAPCAFVVLKEGHTVSPEDLISFTKNYLSSYKIPKQIIYIDEIPKNQICKNNRKKLLELWKTMNVSK